MRFWDDQLLTKANHMFFDLGPLLVMNGVMYIYIFFEYMYIYIYIFTHPLYMALYMGTGVKWRGRPTL